MLDILLTATAAQLGKVALEQVLELGQGALEDYAQDFFKDSLGSGVAKLKASVLKGPMGEAVGEFIKAFGQELKDNDVPGSSIKHHYTGAIKKFVKDKAVKPILGKAFETGCELIDYGQLAAIWTQQYQQPGWGFPDEDFRWKRVAKKYGEAVEGIVKADEELRSLLNTELLEQIAQNTTLFSPGFDTQTYRESLQASYGYLKLYTLDSTDRVDAIKLWRMFIEQTVREALPPTRYDLPSDIKRRLQAEGQLEDAPPPDELEYYQRNYFQQPARKAVDAVMDAQRSVILGDPGAGKSTLLQYLALEWVEGKTDVLPLLIELREYVLAQSASFLDFLHSGSGADWQFDQQQLHQYLSDQPVLVMFDGLDEVFNRPTQFAIIDDIIRFAQRYPQARVVVTSRIIGYNPERFRHADFRQFTIQPLDETEIHEFIDRWYDLAMGADPDKVRLKARLKEAISQSKAIQNLADNPLLLTMMAILNRRQELPRDRADLYDQASRVLLYHWDVDHKRLQLPLDAIGRREKQEMLRLIAYEMQAGEDGLKGNLISAERLTKILTDYLINQGFSEPREKASRLIQQLRERNFILCYRGADTYGFMHRTFLEYFCAVEIVHRFEKQRTLTFGQLRDDIFGQHWQDENWDEVLRLIAGMIAPKFSEQIIEWLIKQDVLFNMEVNRSSMTDRGLRHLLLAGDCLNEIPSLRESNAHENLVEIMKGIVADQYTYWFNGSEIAEQLVVSLAKLLSHDRQKAQWLYSCLEYEPLLKRVEKEKGVLYFNHVPPSALIAITKTIKSDNSAISWLQAIIKSHLNGSVCAAAIQQILNFDKSKNTYILLQEIIAESTDDSTRTAAIRAIAKEWKNELDTLPMLKSCTLDCESEGIRIAAIQELASGWRDDPDTLSIIKSFVKDCKDDWARSMVVQDLVSGWGTQTELFDYFQNIIIYDPFEDENEFQENLRKIVLEALFQYHSHHPRTRLLLSDRATNDPDPQLREWAQKKLDELEKKGGRTNG